MERLRWAIAVHGGAKTISPQEEGSNRDGCRAALAAARAVLAGGDSALDAVEAAVRRLEADPTFNAGLGSALNEAGEVEMCAAIMRGLDLQVGAVAAIQGVRHPVSVARALLDEDEILLAGDGAYAFAAAHEAELCAPEDLIVAKAEKELAAHDTVGAIALDCAGNLAVACSTGGLAGARRGRIADSALAGSGYYADNHMGAIALSGDGESIARLIVSSRVLFAMERLGPDGALELALSLLPHVGGDGGGIAMSPRGEVGWWHNSPHFAVAAASADDPEGDVWLNKAER